MKRKIGKSVLFLISCMITFCVTYALILPAITMSKDSADDPANATEITGTCEEFQISVKFEGMDKNAFHSFVVNAVAKGGYYLEISRKDTGDVVKKLYFEDSSTLDKEGIYTWKVTDLETKDKDGNPIPYRIKEMNYWQTPDAPVSMEARLTHNDYSTEAIAVTRSAGQNEAVLEYDFTFAKGDILQVWNRYNECAGEAQKEKLKIEADFEGLDRNTLADMVEKSRADNDEGYCLEICYPDTGGIAKKLYLSEAGTSEKEGEYSWEITDLETKDASGQPVLYTIKEKNYKVPENPILAINAELTDWEGLSAIEDTEQDQASLSPDVSFKENDILKIINQYTETPGTCEEFQISVKFEGMDKNAFHNFVVNAVAKGGYYLEISRKDTGDVVKKLYFETSDTLEKDGIYTWKVTDLETKDKNGNLIPYKIKEMNYWQTPDTPVSVEALLTHSDYSTEAVAVTKPAKQNEAVLEHDFTFAEGDILQIWNRYNESAGKPQKEKVKIEADFEGLDSSTLADMVKKSRAGNDEGYCLEICYPDTGGIAKKLYLSEAGTSEKEGEYSWEITDLETKDASGQPVLYTIKEKNYKVSKNPILAINAELTDWKNLSVIEDTEQGQASLSPNVSFKENDILKITNQYQSRKRTKKIRICTHLDGLKPEELQKLIGESTPKNKDGFYIEIKEKTVARNNAYVKELYLSDASSVSSDSTTVSWDIEDLPVLDSSNEPISYQVSQYNYPVNNYAETVVSANITRSDSTVSEIGTTPDTEHAVAGLDDVSFDSDLDTTVDTIDISNRYTNDFSMTCYDKNGKPIENAKVTVKTPGGEVIATGMTAAAGSGVAAGTVGLSGLSLPGGATAVLTVAGSTIVITLTAALLYNYYKNGSNVIREVPEKPDQPVTPDEPGKKDDDEEMKYITLTLKKEWKRSENQAPKGVKVKFIVYKSSDGSTDTEKIAEVVLDGKTDNIEVKPWEAKLKNLEGGIIKKKQVIKQYTYYVKEEPLDGYETTYKGTAGEELSPVPILVSGKGEKAVWACTGTDGTVTAVNNEKYKLPKTGGSGTWKYTVVGSLLITISLLYRYIRGKKRERRR